MVTSRHGPSLHVHVSSAPDSPEDAPICPVGRSKAACPVEDRMHLEVECKCLQVSFWDDERRVLLDPARTGAAASTAHEQELLSLSIDGLSASCSYSKLLGEPPHGPSCGNLSTSWQQAASYMLLSSATSHTISEIAHMARSAALYMMPAWTTPCKSALQAVGEDHVLCLSAGNTAPKALGLCVTAEGLQCDCLLPGSQSVILHSQPVLQTGKAGAPVQAPLHIQVQATFFLHNLFPGCEGSLVPGRISLSS